MISPWKAWGQHKYNRIEVYFAMDSAFLFSFANAVTNSTLRSYSTNVRFVSCMANYNSIPLHYCNCSLQLQLPTAAVHVLRTSEQPNVDGEYCSITNSLSCCLPAQTLITKCLIMYKM